MTECSLVFVQFTMDLLLGKKCSAISQSDSANKPETRNGDIPISKKSRNYKHRCSCNTFFESSFKKIFFVALKLNV